MDDIASLAALLLSAMGLTILIVWPQDGPGAWLRERALRPLLPGTAKGVFDCYVCLGFWSGLALAPAWWLMTGQAWSWAACLMTPAIFWLALRGASEQHIE